MATDPKIKESLVREFDECPVGPHSPELQRALNVMRGEEMAGKYVLICLEPHARWMLGELTGKRGEAVKRHANKVFDSLLEAEKEVFRLRAERYAERLSALGLTERSE